MNEKFLVLERNIQSDLEAINRLYEALGSPELTESESQETMIVAAYRLHSLYMAFENIFRNIAASFENQLDKAGWHRQLLQRMRLDLTPLRPAVIDAEAYDRLDEMLRFRHVFRTMYGLDLDPLRLQVVLRKALELKPIYQEQIERFLQFLRDME
ncbi:MAG TPA: antitoxin [Thermoanaerobaculia bacterium]|nr:antitoxin [Thermoanaerobaculia bacterium]